MSLADKVSLPAGQRLKASKLMESSEREREREMRFRHCSSRYCYEF